MRNFSRIILCSFLLFAGSLSAQTFKFGHIDVAQLLQVMPEKDAAQKSFAKVQSDIEAQSNTMQKEYADKLKEYQTQQKTLTDAIRQVKEDELQSISTRIQTFQQQAQENLSKENDKLFQPVIEKARKAIAEVGKEQGLLYVFDVNGVLYHSEQSMDLLPLVKTKLGIK
jgi:outer membrane protein